MECICDIKSTKLNNTVITIGKFDGLHKGHSKLFEILNEKAEGRKKVVLTFAAKPIDVLNHEQPLTIVTEEEKKLLCESKGMDVYISLPLTKDFLSLTPEQFIEEILVKRLGISLIVCGPDFTFGKYGKGNTATLKEYGFKYGFEVIVVEKEKYHNKDIGSTDIRQKILEGNIQEVNEMLGHSYNVIGIVKKGRQLGRTMQLPTVNIEPEKSKILPPRGVYKSIVIYKGKSYNAITNVGLNPTITEGNKMKVESHILDFDNEIYGDIIEVRFLEFIRPERKFDSIKELKNQIQKDINECFGKE